MLRKIYWLFLLSLSTALDNGLGLTPPRGYFLQSCSYGEEEVRKATLFLQSLGHNYKYLVLQCWQSASRSPQGLLKMNQSRFPSGIQSLVAFLHNKKLLLGLQTDVSRSTRQGLPGSYGYEAVDANTFARWGVDFVFLQNNDSGMPSQARFAIMVQALNQTKRPMFVGLNNQGREGIAMWGVNYGNSWRSTPTIVDSFVAFTKVLDEQSSIAKYGKKGGWNDPGLLGCNRLTSAQSQALFVVWAVLKAPLFISCISAVEVALLTNEELLDISANGEEGWRVRKEIYQRGVEEIWAAWITSSTIVVVFFNQANTTTTFTLSLSQELWIQNYNAFNVRDPIRHLNLGITTQDIIKAVVFPHSVQARTLEIY